MALVDEGRYERVAARRALAALLVGLVFLSCGLFAAQATATAFVGDNAGGRTKGAPPPSTSSGTTSGPRSVRC